MKAKKWRKVVREARAKAVEDAAADMASHYPTSMFPPLTDADHARVTEALGVHTSISRDRVSADMMRRAVTQLDRFASEIRRRQR